jgi:hypothetical protein
MKIMKAYELLARLNLLTLAGQDENGELEWIGNTKNWGGIELEQEAILRDYELSKII